MKAVVLVSGGLDSAVTAALARRDGCITYFLTVAYGQRHGIEVDRAARLAKALGAADHLVLEVNLRAIGGSALTGDMAVPKDRRVESRQAGIPITYVPARNTIFLALALAYAETVEASRIYLGANVIDYSGYPDCRPDFLQAFEEVAQLGTRAGREGHRIQIQAPLIEMTKTQIVRTGLELQVPFHLTHSCYDPAPDGTACRRCDSCLIRLEAFRAAGVPDPIAYQYT